MHFFSAFFFLISTFFESISTEKTRNFIDFCIDLIFRRVIGCPTLLEANSLTKRLYFDFSAGDTKGFECSQLIPVWPEFTVLGFFYALQQLLWNLLSRNIASKSNNRGIMSYSNANDISVTNTIYYHDGKLYLQRLTFFMSTIDLTTKFWKYYKRKKKAQLMN